MRVAGIFLLLVFRANSVLATDPLSDEEVIGLLRHAVSRYDSVEFTASAHRRSSGSEAIEAGPTSSDQQMLFRRVGPRILYSKKHKQMRPDREVPSFWQSDTIVYENGDVQTIFTPLDSSFQQIPGESSDLRLILYSKHLAGTQKRDRDSVSKLPMEFGSIVWTMGDFHVLEYIDNATELAITQDAAGATINIETQFGDLELLLSKSHGWLPQTFKVVSNPEHRFVDGKLLREVFAQGSIQFLSRVWEGEVKEFATDKNGDWFAKEIGFTCRSKYRNHPEGLTSVETKVNELVSLQPSTRKTFARSL